MPAADSIYAPLVEVPMAPLNMQASASTIIGRVTSGKSPFSSSIPPAAPTPTSVPSVSRRLIRNSVSRTGRKLQCSTPTMSSLPATARRSYSSAIGEAEGIADRRTGRHGDEESAAHAALHEPDHEQQSHDRQLHLRRAQVAELERNVGGLGLGHDAGLDEADERQKESDARCKRVLH